MVTWWVGEVRGEGGSCAASVLSVSHAVGVDGEHGLGLRQAGGVIDLADSCLAAALSQVQPVHTRTHTDVTTSTLTHTHPVPQPFFLPLFADV